MRIAFISDTHQPLFIRNFKHANIIEKTTDYFLELCKNYEADIVVHIGDMVHVKENISLDSLIHHHNQFRKIYNSYKTYCIPGNHDMLQKKDTTLNFVKIYEDNCYVVDIQDKFKLGNITAHALAYDSQDLLIERIKSIDTKNNLLFGHFGVNGFSYQEDGYTDKQEKITKAILKKFKRVFLGHFHTHQIQDNICYVSSPYQQRFGDDGGSYGFTFYDTDTDEIFFEENIHTPRFIQLDLTKENIIYASGVENSFIKFKVKKNVDKQTLIKIKSLIEKTNIEVSFDYNIKRDDTKIIKLENWDTLISKDADQIISDAVDTLDETDEGKKIIKEIILSNDKKSKK